MASVTFADHDGRPGREPLPIDGHLAAIRGAVHPGATVLIQAPPGAGKTTRVPLALMEVLARPSGSTLPQGRILMVEPRRLAARSAAHRLAEELGESVGQRVGYTVRLESRTSRATCVEVVTGGIFLRRLQADPALEDVDCVIFDEFHERGAEADLALALVRQSRSLLHPDLRILLMSATLDAGPLAEGLGGARVITSSGRHHPVEVSYQRPRERERLDRQVIRALEQHWLDVRASAETVLIFLPGRREIESVRRAIEATPWGEGLQCCPLHGQLSLAAQNQAISRATSRAGKLVLATSIAESSLTIDGVRLVIDSGLSRLSRFDPNTGMDGLITVPASQASADQRCGRAGRLGPGRCLRLWSPSEHHRRPAFATPELMEADPMPIALELALWGSASGDDLPWLQAPPAAPLQGARSWLHDFGAIKADGRITPHGRAMAGMGLHPRLAHMLLEAHGRGWDDLACSLAVLLSERDPLDRRVEGCDLMARLDWLAGDGGRERQRLHSLIQQLKGQISLAGADADAFRPTPERSAGKGATDLEMTARLVCWAYPERVALARDPGAGRDIPMGRFLMRGGRGARLPEEDPLGGAEALAVAAVDGQGEDARIHLAVRLPSQVLEDLAVTEAHCSHQARWDSASGRVRCERTLRLGALVLERTPWNDAGDDAVSNALLEGVRLMGLDCLPWTLRCRQLQARLTLANRLIGEPWPDRSPAALELSLDGWLAPHLHGMRGRQDLQHLDLEEALWGPLPWERRQSLGELLPEDWPVPSGRRIRLDYSQGEPVLAVKLQEMFGSTSNPSLLEGRLPITLQLLSPAGRPAAITRDLPGFWTHGYSLVRKDLRGRYPKHPWPEDPRQGTPTALTSARLKQRSSPSS